MSASDRRALTLVLAALAVGIAVWAIGRLHPGIDAELARRGGTVVPILHDRGPAVATALERLARAAGPGITLQLIDGAPAIVGPATFDPGPGFRPPRSLSDGRRAFLPTPDRAERWRKRAFNGLVERLDTRLEALPSGRGQATLPGSGELQLELTPDVPLDWLSTVLAPGHLTLWRGPEPVADELDVVRAEIEGAVLRLALRDDVGPRLAPAAHPIEARLDGQPLARGPVGDAGFIELPLLPETTAEARARAALLLGDGPLPLPVRAGPLRALSAGP